MLIRYADELPAGFDRLSIIYKEEQFDSCRGRSSPERSSPALPPKGS